MSSSKKANKKPASSSLSQNVGPDLAAGSLDVGAHVLVSSIGSSTSSAADKVVIEEVQVTPIINEYITDEVVGGSFETSATELGEVATSTSIESGNVVEAVSDWTDSIGEVIGGAGEMAGTVLEGAGEVAGAVLEGAGELIGDILGGLG